MNPFEVLLTTPILNLLIAFYKILETIAMPGAMGLAIILLTVVIRMLLWPLTATQLKSAQKMASLKPHLDRIKSEHGHDKIRHQQAITQLYKDHGVNPAAGCLPLLLQLPVFFALYQVLLKIVTPSAEMLAAINAKLYIPLLHLDKVPSTSFLGFNISAKPSDFKDVGVIILAIPLITGFLQFIQSKIMVPANRNELKIPSKKPQVKTKDQPNFEESMASMQSQMAVVMPLMIAYFSYNFPVGLALYWNVFTIIGIIQQYLIAGPGSLGKYLPEKWRK